MSCQTRVGPGQNAICGHGLMQHSGDESGMNFDAPCDVCDCPNYSKFAPMTPEQEARLEHVVPADHDRLPTAVDNPQPVEGPPYPELGPATELRQGAGVWTNIDEDGVSKGEARNVRVTPNEPRVDESAETMSDLFAEFGALPLPKLPEILHHEYVVRIATGTIHIKVTYVPDPE